MNLMFMAYLLFCFFFLLQTMQAVNKKMDPQKTLQTMQNFQKENAKMEMTEEMSKYSPSIFKAQNLFTDQRTPLNGIDPLESDSSRRR